MICALSMAVIIVLVTRSGAMLETTSLTNQGIKDRGTIKLECFSDSNSDEISWKGPSHVDLKSRGNINKVHDSSILTIQNAGVMDTGLYTCFHGNSLINFNVTVWGIPSFNSEVKTEFVVAEGEDLFIPCRVDNLTCTGNSAACGVFWFRNKNGSIHSRHSISSISDVNGTTNELFLQNIRGRDAGLYTCRFQKTSSDESLHFHVTVVTRPNVNKSIEYTYKEVSYPYPLVLHCPVLSGENTTENPLVVSWTYMNEFNQPQHELGSELRIDEQYTRGTYKCTATNNIGSDSLSVFVEIINVPPLPEEVRLPATTLVKGTQRVMLRFSYPTSPVALNTLKYEWEVYQEDHWVSAIKNERFHVTHRGHLRIMDVTVSDAGLYRVNISNTVGHSLQTKRLNVH